MKTRAKILQSTIPLFHYSIVVQSTVYTLPIKRKAQLHVIVDLPEESVNVGGEFDDEIFSPSRLKTHTKTSRKKRNSHTYSIAMGGD